MIKLAVFCEKKDENYYFDTFIKEHKHEIEVVYRTSKPMTVEEARKMPAKVDAVIILPHALTTREVIEVLKEKNVKVISMRSVGTDSIDVSAASEMGIEVVNVPAYSPQAIAETAVFLILASMRRFHETIQDVQKGRFEDAKRIGDQLDSKVIGIYGFGHIGQSTAKLLSGFGTDVIAYVPNGTPQNATDFPNVRFIQNQDDFLAEADVISLHIPNTPQTQGLVNTAFLAKTKPGVILVNTARGQLVDTAAMIDALESGHVRFYGTDVYEREGKVFNTNFTTLEDIEDKQFFRLVTNPHVIVMPHIAFNTYTSVQNMVKFGIENIIDLLDS